MVVAPLGEDKIGSFICYQSAFPTLVRQFAQNGAEVLFNLSNDGYFGRSASAREQHLLVVRRRAADLPYSYRRDQTLYTRYGDWFAWSCAVVAVIAIAQTIVRTAQL